MNDRLFVLILFLGAVLLTPGCGPQPTPREPPRDASLPTATPVSIPAGAEKPVAVAKQDLATRLNKQEQEISLVRVESVDWSDTSLGCPRPGMAYAQVITPGYRILLAAGGSDYEYHSDRSGRVVSCP